MVNVCILDYGSGNIKSVKNLLEFLKVKFIISNNSAKIKKCSHIILPGVGAFQQSMKKLINKVDIKFLEDQVLNKNKPFLGICVGMQLLADSGEEFGKHSGLGWISGKVIKLKSKVLPHIGWNEIKIKKKDEVFKNLEEKDFYFVNSYHFKVKEKKFVIAESTYQNKFCSVVRKKNIIGVQFHPEKSQHAGKKFIQNFLEIK